MSQELEKCLDCLLLISDSVTALGEEDTLGNTCLAAFFVWLLFVGVCNNNIGSTRVGSTLIFFLSLTEKHHHSL